MGQDVWRFQRWAREQKLGNATRKLILTSLAITAESNSGSGFMSQSDLAEYAECSIRTVSAHLKALEAAGFLERQRRFSKTGRRLADGFLLLMPGVTEWPNGEPVTTGSPLPPEDFSSGHLTSPPPEVQGAEQEQPLRTAHTENRSARADDPRLSLPTDFPDDLRPHAGRVLPILAAVAEQHQATRVWPLQLGKLLMRFRRKPLVAVAHDLDEWAVDPSRKIRDVLRTYRTFLDRTHDLQGIERLDSDGLPISKVLNGSGSPARSNGRPMSNAERVEANIQALHAASLAADR